MRGGGGVFRRGTKFLAPNAPNGGAYKICPKGATKALEGFIFALKFYYFFYDFIGAYNYAIYACKLKKALPFPIKSSENLLRNEQNPPPGIGGLPLYLTSLL